MPRLERIRLYPVKGLDGIPVDAAEVLDSGTLEHDREFALFDADATPPEDAAGSVHSAGVFNAKRSDRFHRLDTDFDPASAVLSVDTADGAHAAFELESEQDAASAWFSDYFDADLTLHRNPSLGFVDRRTMGPSVVSTATLEAVASWFDGMSVESARRRLRANLEVSGVPAFWEDRFVGDDAPAFTVDGVRIEGATACARCVVPERDPETGEPTPAFRERFLRKREETFPDWADEDAFDHFYSLMLISRVPTEHRGETLSRGAPVELAD